MDPFFFQKTSRHQFLDLEVNKLTPRVQGLKRGGNSFDTPADPTSTSLYGPFLGWKGRVAGPKVHCNRLDVATEGGATFWWVILRELRSPWMMYTPED